MANTPPAPLFEVIVENHIKDELVRYALAIIDIMGMDYLLNFRYFIHACGCNGPTNGMTLCGCSAQRMLAENLVEIVSEIDEEAARRLAISKILNYF